LALSEVINASSQKTNGKYLRKFSNKHQYIGVQRLDFDDGINTNGM